MTRLCMKMDGISGMQVVSSVAPFHRHQLEVIRHLRTVRTSQVTPLAMARAVPRFPSTSSLGV
jgi:hypothetical protein